MPALTNQKRNNLLAGMRLDRGQAEGSVSDPVSDPAHSFFPVAEHLRALDPTVVLVVGPRGAGKSKLLQVVEDDRIRRALLRRTSVSLPSGQTGWLRGFPYGKAGPSPALWERFLSDVNGSVAAAQELWLALLVRIVRENLPDADSAALQPLLSVPASDTVALRTAVRNQLLAAETALDALDESLKQSNRWLFVAYDELDTLFYSSWDTMLVAINGLVGLWASYSRRWERLRAKLFLRTDFFRAHTGSMGADLAKLAARRVELTWSDRNLYGVLIKHLANRTDQLLEYCESAGVSFETDTVLGKIPEPTVVNTKALIERMCGQYMGANKQKGATVTWLLNSVRDGRAQISPRNLLLLVELAAERELRQPRKKRGAQLLHHVSLRNALDDVSGEYVNQASTSEYPWLNGLKERLKENRLVPWERIDLENSLRRDWDASWGRPPEPVRPPASDAPQLIDRLIDLGIFRSRHDDAMGRAVRIDVPDLLLRGLDLRRHGGVGRK